MAQSPPERLRINSHRHWWLCFGLLWTLSGIAGEPVATVQRLSGFRQVDVVRLLTGEVLTERGPLMDFPNGISAQTCFAVNLPAAEVARRLQGWSPAPHPELKVSVFHILPVSCRVEDFSQLQLNSALKPVRWLVGKTVAKSGLNLSRAEATELASSANVTAGWVKMLAARVTAFQQHGWDGIAPYEVAGKATSPVKQLRALLRDQAEIAMEFSPVLRKSGLLAGVVDAPVVPVYYWSWFEANHHATLNLGAAYRVEDEARWQVADVEYYVSGDYYTAVTLYEIWPVTGGTLVWRVDLFAAPMLVYTKGIERLAYEVMMVHEIKQETRCMIQDLKVKQ